MGTGSGGAVSAIDGDATFPSGADTHIALPKVTRPAVNSPESTSVAVLHEACASAAVCIHERSSNKSAIVVEPAATSAAASDAAKSGTPSSPSVTAAEAAGTTYAGCPGASPATNNDPIGRGIAREETSIIRSAASTTTACTLVPVGAVIGPSPATLTAWGQVPGSVGRIN